MSPRDKVILVCLLLAAAGVFVRQWHGATAHAAAALMVWPDEDAPQPLRREGGNPSLAAARDPNNAAPALTTASLITQQRRLTAADGAALDQFGFAVALGGDAVLVGAVTDDLGAQRDQGSAYVFVCPACPRLTLASGASGSSNGEAHFTVARNPAATRRGTLTVAGRTMTIIQTAPLAIVSAASFTPGALASESIVAAFGNGLANATEAAATQPLPTTLANVRVSVRDSQGAERFAPLFFVSPGQINFQMPPDTAPGQALLRVIVNGEPAAATNSPVARVAPGLFAASANGQGAAIGLALHVRADGAQSFEALARFDAGANRFVAAPINPGPISDRVFLVLFGTGLRQRTSLSAVSASIGGVNAEVTFAGPQGGFVGLDQLNVAVPRNLAGCGEVELRLLVDGQEANSLKIAIQ